MTRSAAEIGSIVRSRRLELGLTQVQVIEAARASGGGAAISEPTMRAVETGRTEASDLTLASISRGLGWTADTLSRIRDGEDPPPPSSPGAGQQPEEDVELAALASKLRPDQRQVIEDLIRTMLKEREA